jgi:hypothetical protein
MYIFNAVLILFNLQLYSTYKLFQCQHLKKKQFWCTNVNDIYDDVFDPQYANNEKDVHNVDNYITSDVYEYNKAKSYKKMKGNDERHVNNVEDFINNKLLLNKIRDFNNKKILLEKLVNIIKTRHGNGVLYHLYDSNVLDEVNKYNNDNKNISEYTPNIMNGGLLNDW